MCCGLPAPPRIEYVTVTPEGFRYRGQVFPTVNGLFRWFKDHYQDPVPGKQPKTSVPQLFVYHTTSGTVIKVPSSLSLKCVLGFVCMWEVSKQHSRCLVPQTH